MIDLHTHILPGIDDGPQDWDRLALARALSDAGVTEVAATSHISRQYSRIAERPS